MRREREYVRHSYTYRILQPRRVPTSGIICRYSCAARTLFVCCSRILFVYLFSSIWWRKKSSSSSTTITKNNNNDVSAAVRRVSNLRIRGLAPAFTARWLCSLPYEHKMIWKCCVLFLCSRSIRALSLFVYFLYLLCITLWLLFFFFPQKIKRRKKSERTERTNE